MKLLNFKNGVVGASLVVLGSFLFIAACGDGGTQTKINPQAIDPQLFDFVYPKHGDKNVCTLFIGTVHTKTKGACASTGADVQNSIRLSLEREQIPVVVKGPFMTPDGLCDYEFSSPDKNLVGLQRYQVELVNTISNNVQPNTASFTTAEADRVDCGDGTRFIVNNINLDAYGHTEEGTFGTIDPNTNKLNYDIVGFAANYWNTMVTIPFLKQPETIARNKVIQVEFNQEPNMDILAANTSVFELVRDNFGGFTGVKGDAIPILLEASQTDKRFVSIRAASGKWAAGIDILAVINKGTRSRKGQVLSAKNAERALSWVGRAKVSNVE